MESVLLKVCRYADLFKLRDSPVYVLVLVFNADIGEKSGEENDDDKCCDEYCPDGASRILSAFLWCAI